MINDIDADLRRFGELLCSLLLELLFMWVVSIWEVVL
jgi:hypothetical protein